MSRSNIQKGRYKKQLKESLKGKLCTVPRNFKYTMDDELIQRVSLFFHKVKNIDWTQEIQNHFEVLKNMTEAIQNTFLPSEDFMDIYNSTGIEIDNRSIFTKDHWKFGEIILKYNLTFMRSLPGFRELNEKDFINILRDHVDNMLVLASFFSNIDVLSEDLCLSGTQQNFIIDKATLRTLLGNDFILVKDEMRSIINNLKINHLELLFVLVLPILSPNRKYHHFSDVYNRLLKVFVRYLQTNHGANYHKRLRDLMNFHGRFSDFNTVMKYWRLRNQNYYSRMVKSPVLRIFFFGYFHEWTDDVQLFCNL